MKDAHKAITDALIVDRALPVGAIGYPDLIVRRPDGTLEVLEVKTGGDPPLTPNQAAYLPALQIGGHIYSNDPRIQSLGLSVGVPFPPMKVGIIFAPGPGLPYKIIELDPAAVCPERQVTKWTDAVSLDKLLVRKVTDGRSGPACSSLTGHDSANSE